MGEAEAVALNTRVGRTLFELSRTLDAPIDVVSRSDSTLRGHVIAEVAALDAARREVLGRGYDGILLIPAYLEAGRFTEGDVHWARVAGEGLPGRRHRVRARRHLRVLRVQPARVRRREERRNHHPRTGHQHHPRRHPQRRPTTGGRDPRRGERRRVRRRQRRRVRRPRHRRSRCARRAGRRAGVPVPHRPLVPAATGRSGSAAAAAGHRHLARRATRRARPGGRRLPRRPHQPAGGRGPGTRRPHRNRARGPR